MFLQSLGRHWIHITKKFRDAFLYRSKPRIGGLVTDLSWIVSIGWWRSDCRGQVALLNCHNSLRLQRSENQPTNLDSQGILKMVKGL